MEITLELKVDDVIRAAQENGLNWGRDHFYDGKTSCILGIAARNILGNNTPLVPEDIGEFSEYLAEKLPYRLGSLIAAYNDGPARSFSDALRFLVDQLTPFKDEIITLDLARYFTDYDEEE